MVRMVFNFSIMFIALATFVTRDLHSTILLNLWAARQLFATFTTAMQSCVRSCCILSVFIFIFQKIIIEERHFYVFSWMTNWSLCGLERPLFLKSFFQDFLISTANLLIISGLLFCLDYLSLIVVSIISSWSWRLPTSTVALLLLLRDGRWSSTNDFFILYDDDTRL